MSDTHAPSHTSDPVGFINSAKAAAALLQVGQAEAALVQFEQLMAQYPPSAGLLNLAATAARALGQTEKAEHYWRAAISAQPDHIGAHNNLGLLLMGALRHAEAEAIFLKALEFQPGHAEIRVNLGNLYRDMQRPADADAAYRDVLSRHPEHVDALYNLGLLLFGAARIAEAETFFRKALAIRPEQPDVHNELGNLLTDARRYAEAEQAYRRAIMLKPDYADAYCNLGILLMDCRRPQDAWGMFQQTLRIDPRHADAINSLGNLLKDAGKTDEAEKAYRHALSIRPDSATIRNNLGNLLMDSGRFAEAENTFHSALALRPDYGHALGQAVTCARRRYSWTSFENDQEAVLDALRQGIDGIPAMMVQSLPGAGAMRQREAAVLATNKAIKPYLDLPPLADKATAKAHDRLHIGYISSEFREHAVMHLFCGILESHSRDRFKIHAYSTGPASADAYRQRIERGGEVFRDFRLTSDEEAARRIAADEIDILVDLTGHSGDFRLAITALRPAPIIVNWLGYPGSMGHPRLADYIIGDRILTPPEHAEHYSEVLALMPNCYQPNDDQISAGPVPGRAEAGLPAEGFVFCSFNQGYKLTPEMFTVWCDLLVSVPGSVLWLLSPGDAAAMANLRQEAADRGIDPARLIFAPALPMAGHLGRLQLADLFLDTFPYGSGATGSNALRAGVPMITRIGETYVGRMAASQLHAIGMPELVTASFEEYFRLARELALDAAKLAAVRAKLGQNRAGSPLFDTPGFTRDLEALYRKIWTHAMSGEPTRVVE